MSAYVRTEAQLRAVPFMLEEQNVPVESGQLMTSLLDQLAERVATVVIAHLHSPARPEAEWLDSRHAADYLGVHRDTLRKLASERAIPSEQDGPGCKLYFRRADLDRWRAGGGRPRHLAAVAQRAV